MKKTRKGRKPATASPQLLELLQLIQGLSSLGFLLAIMKAGGRRS